MPDDKFSVTLEFERSSGIHSQGIAALLSMACRLLVRDDHLAYRVAVAILDATIEDLEAAEQAGRGVAGATGPCDSVAPDAAENAAAYRSQEGGYMAKRTLKPSPGDLLATVISAFESMIKDHHERVAGLESRIEALENKVRNLRKHGHLIELNGRLQDIEIKLYRLSCEVGGYPNSPKSGGGVNS